MSFSLFTRFLGLVSVCVMLGATLASCSLMVASGQRTTQLVAGRAPSLKPRPRPAAGQRVLAAQPRPRVWCPLALNYHGVPHGLVL